MALASWAMTQEEATRLFAQGDVQAVIEAAVRATGLPDPTGDVRDGTRTTHPLTPLGNALRLFDSHGGVLRYLTESRGWLRWEDGRWVRDNEGAAVRELAAGLPTRIYGEGKDQDYQRNIEAFARWARKSGERSTIHDAVALLADRGDMRVSMAALDANTWLCGMNGGRQVLDLKTGQARPATQGDYVTKTLGVACVGDALRCPTWVRFIDDVMGGDKEVTAWLQRFCGYLLTGSTQEQIMLFCHGIGANGKSVFVDVLARVLGDYAQPLESEALVDHQRAAGAASPHLAALRGARMAFASETSQGMPMAEGLVKSLTGGDVLQCRELYGKPFEFTPRFKLLICGNHKPLISGTDNGIWRRMRLLPFSRVFAPNERDPHLTAKLLGEAEHILAWVLEGCLAWQREGLADVPSRIQAETAQYQQDMDTLGEWIRDCCTVSESVESSTRLLYQSYTLWAEESGLRRMSMQAFGRQLTERGFKEWRSKTARGRMGLKATQVQP